MENNVIESRLEEKALEKQNENLANIVRDAWIYELDLDEKHFV